MKVHRWLTAGPEWEGADEGGWALAEEERLTPLNRPRFYALGRRRAWSLVTYVDSLLVGHSPAAGAFRILREVCVLFIRSVASRFR
jgi:hypothetical protein